MQIEKWVFTIGFDVDYDCFREETMLETEHDKWVIFADYVLLIYSISRDPKTAVSLIEKDKVELVDKKKQLQAPASFLGKFWWDFKGHI